MNVLVLLAVGVGALWLGSHFYGGYVSRRVGLSPDQPTPARQLNDGRDYVPTRTPVVFAHHFSAIAGAGPIVGPTMALIYGFAPSLLWVLLGGVLIGAVHDFTALFASLREGGRSMAQIARRTMGRSGFALFISFTTVMIVLVTAAFLNLTKTALTSVYPLTALGLDPSQTLLRVEMKDGVMVGRIGGVASTSVLIITGLSPLMGYLLYRRRIATPLAYLLAIVVCVVSVLIGLAHPVTVSPDLWGAILSVYVLVAAAIPVWMVLQPRDFINTQLLYAGLAGLVVALVCGGMRGLQIRLPAVSIAEGNAALGAIWPMMFVTVACGAISGFHSLVSSGTTSKQCESEPAGKRIAFDGMLLESLMALVVILVVGSTLAHTEYRSLVFPAPGGPKSNPVLAFSLAAGRVLNGGLGFVPTALGTVFGILMLEGFLVTTLDVAVRLNRYLLEELWGVLFAKPPGFLRQYWFNAGLSVALMLVTAASGAVEQIWPVFASANQLLAALGLLVVSLWLLNRQTVPWFTMVPAMFMLLTTLGALGILVPKYLSGGKYVLLAAAILLFALALGVVVVASQGWLRWRLARRPADSPAS